MGSQLIKSPCGFDFFPPLSWLSLFLLLFLFFLSSRHHQLILPQPCFLDLFFWPHPFFSGIIRRSDKTNNLLQPGVHRVRLEEQQQFHLSSLLRVNSTLSVQRREINAIEFLRHSRFD